MANVTLVAVRGRKPETEGEPWRARYTYMVDGKRRRISVQNLDRSKLKSDAEARIREIHSIPAGEQVFQI